MTSALTTFVLLATLSACPKKNAAPVALSLGQDFGCALLADGKVSCWGTLGGENGKPAVVPGVEGATSIAAGALSLWIVKDHKASTWNAEHVLRPGPDFGDVLEMAAGADHACARVADGTVKCVGENLRGQLGDGTQKKSDAPVKVLGLEGATRIAAAPHGFHTCAIDKAKALWCWGANASGQLGDGSNEGKPKAVKAMIGGVVDVALGDAHTCTLHEDGSLHCFGDNYFGQTGQRGPSRGPTESLVPDMKATKIAAGGVHTCALLAGGEVRCWGWNVHGQIGVGSARDGAVIGGPELRGALDVACGTMFTCARVEGGALCWGDDHKGQLGDAATKQQPSPVRVQL